MPLVAPELHIHVLILHTSRSGYTVISLLGTNGLPVPVWLQLGVKSNVFLASTAKCVSPTFLPLLKFI